MTAPFHPVTKKMAAETLDVSIRTIESWIADGQMPAPERLGRRVYWHPDVFYSWLASRLGQSAQSNTATPGARAREGTKVDPGNAPAVTPVNAGTSRKKGPTRSGTVESARARDAARLARLTID